MNIIILITWARIHDIQQVPFFFLIFFIVLQRCCRDFCRYFVVQGRHQNETSSAQSSTCDERSQNGQTNRESCPHASARGL